jgi:hypothetical protein
MIFSVPLESGVYIPWSTAVRRVARDILEFTLLFALRAFIGRCSGCNKIAAFTAFPIGQIAIGANIPGKPAIGTITTVCTYPSLLFFSHSLLLVLGLVAIIVHKNPCYV